MELYELNLRSAAEGVRTKKFSALELFDSCLARAAACEPNLSALITGGFDDKSSKWRSYQAQRGNRRTS